jgi:hypothetical protein
MHCLNSGPGAAGTQSPFDVQIGSPGAKHARTNLSQGGGEALVLAVGKQPICSGVAGATVIDCTQGTPPQSFPAGIGFSPLQVPLQPAGGSEDVCVTPEPSPAQLAAAAVTMAGRSHDPLVGPHVQASHWIGPFR